METLTLTFTRIPLFGSVAFSRFRILRFSLFFAGGWNPKPYIFNLILLLFLSFLFVFIDIDGKSVNCMENIEIGIEIERERDGERSSIRWRRSRVDRVGTQEERFVVAREDTGVRRVTGFSPCVPEDRNSGQTSWQRGCQRVSLLLFSFSFVIC